jgi:hypothetical protein
MMAEHLAYNKPRLASWRNFRSLFAVFAITEKGGLLNQRFTGCAVKTPKRAVKLRSQRWLEMRDWIADWNKWSRAERVLALLVTFMLLALPLGLLMTGKAGV